MQHKGAGSDKSPLLSLGSDAVSFIPEPDFWGPLSLSCSELTMPDVSCRHVSWYAWVQKKATTATFCNARGSKQIQQRPLPPMLFGIRPPLLPPFPPLVLALFALLDSPPFTLARSRTPVSNSEPPTLIAWHAS